MIIETILIIAMMVLLGFALRNMCFTLLLGGLLAISASFFWLHSIFTVASAIGAVSLVAGFVYAKFKVKF